MNLKLKEGQSIAEHLNYFEGMIAQLSVVGLSLMMRPEHAYYSAHYQIVGTLWWRL